MHRACLLVLLVALPVTAKPKTEAAVRYDRGVSLYKEGNYPAALAEFRAAHKAQPTYEVLFNIGLCERRLFKYGDAVHTFKQYLEQGGAKVPKDRRDAVASELEQIRSLTAEVTVQIEGSPAKLTVDGEAAGSTPLKEPVLVGPGKHVFRAERGDETDEVSIELVSAEQKVVRLNPVKASAKPGTLLVDSAPPGAVLTVDGQLAGVGPLKLPLAAGGHQVVAELDGYQLARTEVVISAGEERKLTVALERAAAAGGSSAKRKLSLPGVIVAGAGLLVLGGGIGLNLVAQNASRQTTALFATGGTWDAAAMSAQTRGLQAQTWSGVLAAVGIAALVAGVAIIVVTLFSEPSSGGAEEETVPAAEETP